MSWICSNCGQENREESSYCLRCGRKNKSDVQLKHSMKGSKIILTLQLLAGAAGMIFGIICWRFALMHSSGTNYASSAAFGADFYTDIYEATRYAANNIRCVVEMLYSIAYILSFLFVFGSGFYMLSAIAGYIKTSKINALLNQQQPKVETSAPTVSTATVEHNF